MNPSNSKPPFHNLVIEGGGAKNIACLGALKYLEEKDYISELSQFAGSSAGSLIVLLITIGYNSTEIFDIIVKKDLSNIFKSPWVLRPFNLIFKFGLNKPHHFIKLLKQLLQNKGYSGDITFKELFNQTNKTLVITGTNLNKRTTTYFNHIHHPNLKIISAIQASINIPFYFTQHIIDGDHYIDGGVLMNFPLYYFDKYTHEYPWLCCDSTQLSTEFPDPVLTSNNQTLGILTKDANTNTNHIEYHANQKIDGLIEYISATVHTMLNNIEKLNVKSNFWNRTISIQLPYEIEVTNFNPPKQIQDDLWNIGYESAKQFFSP